MKKLLLFACLVTSPVAADPMRFEKVRNGGNCAWCAYTQATGDITLETPKVFEKYLASQEFGPGSVRLHSPGGNLIGGIALGELFRERGIATEVGSSQPIHDAVEQGLFDRAPGVCTSACAYAFLGGIARNLDESAKLGVHRFYQENPLAGSSAKSLSGQELDDAQKLTAALVLYMIKMGVDARLISVAAEAGPNEVRWIDQKEADALRVIYDPSAYKPWRVEPYRGGALAVSESNDGLKRLVASCSKKLGPYVALVDATTSWDVAEWLNQCRNTGTIQGGHAVFGTRVDTSRVHVFRRKEGSVVMRFQLPGYDPPLTSPELLTFGDYPRACSTNEYQGSRENFVPAVRLALRNCHQD